MTHQVIDETGKIWDWNVLAQQWRCVNASGFSNYKDLVSLDSQHGPLYRVARGKQVKTVPALHETVKVILPSHVTDYLAEVEEIYDDEIAVRVVVPRERIKLLDSGEEW